LGVQRPIFKKGALPSGGPERFVKKTLFPNDHDPKPVAQDKKKEATSHTDDQQEKKESKERKKVTRIALKK